MQNTICALSYTDLSNEISQKKMHNLSVVLGLEKDLKMYRVWPQSGHRWEELAIFVKIY